MERTVDVYNMRSDTGFAPAVEDGICTLATCMVQIRKRVGDLWDDIKTGNHEYWIVGRAGSSLDIEDRNQLIFFMKVEEVMSFDYYHRKCPGRSDNIYRVKENAQCSCNDQFCSCRMGSSNYEVIDSKYKYPNHGTEHDIGKGQYVILSRDFRYFGKSFDPTPLLELDKWDINELIWKPKGTKGPFYRKFNFNETDRIIDQLQTIMSKYYEKMDWSTPEPNDDDDDSCSPC